jgi:xanthine dehydrogenase accessory factor
MNADDSCSDTKTINEAISEALDRGVTGVLMTLLETATRESTLRVGEKLVVIEADERVGSLGDSEFDKAVARQAQTFLASREEAKLFRADEFAPELENFRGASVLFERIEAERRLAICGAGHVGASLARLAALVGYHVTLIDDRVEFVQRELFASHDEQDIELIVAGNWADAVHETIGNGRGVSVAIVTRGHKQDEDCLRAAIDTSPDYIGMIGSRRRTNIVLDKLREEGADEDALTRVRAPIGLDIGAISPEEVALAILAEIVAERRGGSGAPLSSWRRS